jgi:hypothetical protein
LCLNVKKQFKHLLNLWRLFLTTQHIGVWLKHATLSYKLFALL